jgi:hypothetical protein
MASLVEIIVLMMVTTVFGNFREKKQNCCESCCYFQVKHFSFFLFIFKTLDKCSIKYIKSRLKIPTELKKKFFKIKNIFQREIWSLAKIPKFFFILIINFSEISRYSLGDLPHPKYFRLIPTL